MKLADLIQQSRFESPAQEAILNVYATSSWLSGEMAACIAPHGVTHPQYNVLRILRGRHPESYTCSQIAERLLDRTPDVTRLLARLEAAGLVSRTRSEADRRAVEVRITDAGLGVLAQTDGPSRETIRRAAQHLSDDELATLSRLLEALRTEQAAEAGSVCQPTDD